MNQALTELIFILDRSGSMAGLEEDTIGGFNSMLEKQRSLEGEVLVSTVLFDHEFKVLHNRQPLSSIKPLTRQDYYVRGTTALLDAIGRSISKIKTVYSKTKKESMPDKVMFVIITDGMENASIEYGYSTVKKMITAQSNVADWVFIFLGANLDAVGVGQRFGMRKDRIAQYHADQIGTRLNFDVIGEAVMEFRRSRTVKDDWKDRVDQDFNARNK